MLSADIRAPQEAVALAERAASLTGRQNATVLDTVAAAYFAADRFDQAVSTAQAAIDVASARGENELASQIRQRLDSYRQRR